MHVNLARAKIINFFFLHWVHGNVGKQPVGMKCWDLEFGFVAMEVRGNSLRPCIVRNNWQWNTCRVQHRFELRSSKYCTYVETRYPWTDPAWKMCVACTIYISTYYHHSYIGDLRNLPLKVVAMVQSVSCVQHIWRFECCLSGIYLSADTAWRTPSILEIPTMESTILLSSGLRGN